MEFIPLDSSSDKTSKKFGKGKKSQETDSLKTGEQNVGSLEGKTKGKIFNDKYKEKMIEKRERKLMGKGKANKRQKKLNENIDEDDEDCNGVKKEKEFANGGSRDKFKKCDKNEEEQVEEDDDNDNENENDDDDDDNETEDEEEKKERAKRRKWMEQDEKKKNRLFVKMKKRIMSDSQIKEFHPDIKQVIFPRKKNTKWCWAVFSSEEKANQAFVQLAKNKEIFVSKPNLASQVEIKREKKMAALKRKKEVKKKFLKMWM